MFFTLLITFVIIQRIVELIVAKKNEKWSKSQGAIEFGKEHYKYIITLHISFFISLIIEYLLDPKMIKTWYIFFIIFVFAQIVRYWSLYSLGKYWNTKILVIPNATAISKGPYRFLKHPNYLVVALELLTIPLIFGAYVTATLFSLLNFFLIYYYRIPQEEAALHFLHISHEK